MRRLRHQSHALETCCLFGRGLDMGSVKMNCDCLLGAGAEDDDVVGFIFASLRRGRLDVGRRRAHHQLSENQDNNHDMMILSYTAGD